MSAINSIVVVVKHCGSLFIEPFLIERLGWEVSVFVFWTISATRTYIKYVVRLCFCNSSNWSRVIADDLRCSVWTITKQPHVSSKAQSFLAIIDSNVYSWFNAISTHVKCCCVWHVYPMNCSEAWIINEAPGNTCLNIWEISVIIVDLPINFFYFLFNLKNYLQKESAGTLQLVNINPIKQIWTKLWNKLDKPLVPWKELTFWRNILTLCKEMCCSNGCKRM